MRPRDCLRCRRLRCAAGFTLVELLVVIAVMLLLIALVLPTLARVRDHARVVVCLSNQHQILVALGTYAGENGQMGPAYRTDGSDCPRPNDNESAFRDWSINFYGGWDEAATEIRGRRKLNPYVTDVDMFRCPADIGRNSPSSSYPYASTYDHVGTSYQYNSNWYAPALGFPAHAAALEIGRTPWVLYGRRFDTFKQPSRLVAVADRTIFYTWPFWLWVPEGPHASSTLWHDPPRYRPREPRTHVDLWFYDARCNVGFLDGHAAFIVLGPFGPGDVTMNRRHCVMDPNFNP